MHIVDFISAEWLAFAFLGAIACMWILIRAGALRNWLDPLLMPVFQVVLTAFLLGLRIIPAIDLLFLIPFFALLSIGRNQPTPLDFRALKVWERTIGVLLPLSIALNIYLASQKGLLLFQEDVGTARQEFYRGWGFLQRLNTVCSLLFGVHWAFRLVAGQGWKPRSVLLLLWTCYLTLSLGSKAGLLGLLTSLGCVLSYRAYQLPRKQILLLVGGVISSIAAMFLLFFDEQAWFKFGVRFISYADGPFYYFQSIFPPSVTLTYPLDDLLVALRVYDDLPQRALGPAINLDYFGFDNELFGPNPQIYVEAHAVFGPLWFFYYPVLACVTVVILRAARTPYGPALLATVAAPLMIDSQYALSNLLNVAMAFLLRAGVSILPEIRLTHAPKQSSSLVSRVQ